MPTDTNTMTTTTTADAAAAAASRGLVRMTHDPRHQVVRWASKQAANRPPR
jgi:hypothetical protein